MGTEGLNVATPHTTQRIRDLEIPDVLTHFGLEFPDQLTDLFYYLIN